MLLRYPASRQNSRGMLSILPKGDQPELKTVLQALAREAFAARSRKRVTWSRLERPAVRYHRFGADQVWWVENDTLVLTDIAKVDEIVDVIEGRRPSALDHPLAHRVVQVARGLRASCGRISRRPGARATFVGDDPTWSRRSEARRVEVGIRSRRDALHASSGGTSASDRSTCAPGPAELRDRVASSHSAKGERLDGNINRPGEEL